MIVIVDFNASHLRIWNKPEDLGMQLRTNPFRNVIRDMYVHKQVASLAASVHETKKRENKNKIHTIFLSGEKIKYFQLNRRSKFSSASARK